MEIVSLVISCIMMLIGVLTFVLTQIHNGKKDLTDKQQEKADINASLAELNFITKSINTTTNDIKADVKALSADVNSIDKRVYKVESEQQTMWRRIDELKEKQAHG